MTMKITSIEPRIMWAGDAGGENFSSTLWSGGAGRNWLFVKIETDQDVHGWGEAALVVQTPTIAQAVTMLSPLLIGENPSNIEYLWQKMFLFHRYRGGVILNSAISAIDQALWDIKGKVLGAPVYQLLGGAVRTRIRTYSGAGNLEQAKRLVDYGLTGIKTHSWYADNNLDERKVIPWFQDHIAEMRQELGDEIDIMVDNHGRSRPSLAIRQIQAIKDYNLLFFEEPVPPDNIDVLKLIRESRPTTDIATGERYLNRWQFKDIIQKQLVDVIQPDICHCGGISEMRRIASLAELYNIQVAPHNPKGPIATAANLHVCAAIPNFLILEHVHPTPLFQEILTETFQMKSGYYDLPSKPGLGIDLDEDIIAANPVRLDRKVIEAYYNDGSPTHP